jgi:hypothetical protein
MPEKLLSQEEKASRGWLRFSSVVGNFFLYERHTKSWIYLVPKLCLGTSAVKFCITRGEAKRGRGRSQAGAWDREEAALPQDALQILVCPPIASLTGPRVSVVQSQP